MPAQHRHPYVGEMISGDKIDQCGFGILIGLLTYRSILKNYFGFKQAKDFTYQKIAKSDFHPNPQQLVLRIKFG
jgi:hypothetical protein